MRQGIKNTVRIIKLLWAAFGAYLDYKFPGRVQRVAKRKLNKAIKKAESMHTLTGKRYYVLNWAQGKMIVVDGDFKGVYKRISGKPITGLDLVNMALYVTPSRSQFRQRK
jgi:hypothetical protein